MNNITQKKFAHCYAPSANNKLLHFSGFVCLRSDLKIPKIIMMYRLKDSSVK